MLSRRAFNRGMVIASSLAGTVGMVHLARGEERMLKLNARSQVKAGGKFTTQTKAMAWSPQETALIICDMWDDHWCRGAAERVVEMAEPMNKLVAAMREQGVFIIHAPSTCTEFYKDTPARLRAKNAKFAKTPVALSSTERWGTGWCYPDKEREPELPIDDTDMGCDCEKKCTISGPWKRQIKTIVIDDAKDAITDNGQELYNLIQERHIKHVMIMGVHLNMCVMGRPFGIRQLKYLGQDVVLVRDMTDTMYNSQKRPFVNHYAGTDLVVEHIERHWCPTITSVDLVGGNAFRFRADTRKS